MCYHQYSQKRHYGAWHSLRASFTLWVPCLDLIPFRHCCLLKSLLQPLYLGASNWFQRLGTFTPWGDLLRGLLVLPRCCCVSKRTCWGIIWGEVQLLGEQGNAVEKKSLGPTNTWAPFNSQMSTWAPTVLIQPFGTWTHICLHTGNTVQHAAVLEVGIELDSLVIVTSKWLMESLFQTEIEIWIVSESSLL